MYSFAYFNDVLRKVSTHRADKIDELLPSNWKKPLKQAKPENEIAAYFFLHVAALNAIYASTAYQDSSHLNKTVNGYKLMAFMI